ncbi:MAG: hypothetical protein AB8H86_26440, partial [Polyangiales bacterium]
TPLRISVIALRVSVNTVANFGSEFRCEYRSTPSRISVVALRVSVNTVANFGIESVANFGIESSLQPVPTFDAAP